MAVGQISPGAKAETAAQLTRLAKASARLLAHQQLTARFLEVAQALEFGGTAAVAGDRALLEDMQCCLADAMQRLSALVQDSDAATLDGLEEEVDDVVWAVATTRLPELESRLDEQRQQVQGAEVVLQDSENRLGSLALELDDARIAGAPFGALEAELFAGSSRLAALRSALKNRLYGELATLSQPLEAAVAELKRHVEAARPQMERVKPLVKQADLLIVRSQQPNGGDYDYRVVLRCADRSQTRGIHIIEDLGVLSQNDHRWVTDQLGALTASAYRRLGPAADTAPHSGESPGQRLRRVGTFLRRVVIPDQMVEFLTGQTWSFNIVTNDLELPWELLCFADDMGGGDNVVDAGALPAEQVFCLGQAISRVPLGKAFPRSAAPHRPQPGRRLRMLLIHADPHGTLPAAAEEVQALADALGPRLELVRLDPHQATVQNLNTLFTDSSFDLIHYAGHAVFDKKDASKSALVLADGLFPAHKVLMLNRGRSLVFLNACDSAASPKQPGAAALGMAPADAAAVAGLASAFLYSGALGCVGSLWPVVDLSAATVAVAFYERLLEGDPVGEALRRGRLACRKADSESGTWAGYVLYGDPTLRLTEV